MKPAAAAAPEAGGGWLQAFEREQMGTEGALKDVVGPLTPEMVLRELKR